MEELRKLINKNLEYTKEIHEQMNKIRRHMMWQTIFSVLKLVVIVVPILLLGLYAAPMLKQVMGDYSQVMQQLDGLNQGGSMDLLKNFVK